MSAPHILSPHGVIPRPRLNKLGLQVGRVALARTASRLRQRSSPPVDQHERDIRSQGFCVIEDFLGPDDYASVRDEYWRIMRDPSVDKRLVRDTRGVVRETFYVEPGGPATECDRLIVQNAELRRLLRCSEGAPEKDFDKAEFQVAFWRHRLDAETGAEPEQSDHTNLEFHADTFYTISKAFFYIETADTSSGAHRYVPGSHRLTPARLAFEYRNSVAGGQASPRIPTADLPRFGAGAPRSFVFDGNSVIVENTYGFHAAGEIAPGRERNLIYVQFRWPPFGRLTRPAAPA